MRITCVASGRRSRIAQTFKDRDGNPIVRQSALNLQAYVGPDNLHCYYARFRRRTEVSTKN